MLMDVGEAGRLFQAALEEHRRDPDDEVVWREVERTREDLERAWCELAVAQ